MKREHSQQKKMITGVIGLPVNKEGKILLTKRHAPARPSWHNKWQLAGGAMEFGETPEQTLARELQEELGVSARIIFPWPIVKTKVWYGDHVDSNADTHITLFCYLVDIGNQKIDLSGDDETSDYHWFTPEEALESDYLPLTDDFVKDAMEVIKANGILKKLLQL